MKSFLAIYWRSVTCLLTTYKLMHSIQWKGLEKGRKNNAGPNIQNYMLLRYSFFLPIKMKELFYHLLFMNYASFKWLFQLFLKAGLYPFHEDISSCTDLYCLIFTTNWREYMCYDGRAKLTYRQTWWHSNQADLLLQFTVSGAVITALLFPVRLRKS